MKRHKGFKWKRYKGFKWKIMRFCRQTHENTLSSKSYNVGLTHFRWLVKKFPKCANISIDCSTSITSRVNCYILKQLKRIGRTFVIKFLETFRYFYPKRQIILIVHDAFFIICKIELSKMFPALLTDPLSEVRIN